MEAIILGHTIRYNWHDCENEVELSETDVEHIESMIKQGYNQGELHSFNPENDDEEISGWWAIK